MQRAKAGVGIIFLIVGAILFAAFVDEQLNAQSEPETPVEEKISAGSK